MPIPKIKATLVESPKLLKKWRMIFERKKDILEVVDFGARYMSDYTIHHDPYRKHLFLKRFHKKIQENKDDPASPMTLSTMILWNKPTIEASLRDYKKKFNFE